MQRCEHMLYQEHKLKTNVILSEKVIQGLDLLSASLEEIVPLIRQEIIENPIFDLDQFQNENPFEQTLEQLPQYYSVKNSNNSNKQVWWENIPNNNSVPFQLKQMAKQFFHNPTDLNIVEHIIGSLNKKGCLSCSLEEIAILTDTNVSQVKSVLITAQQLFPPGIAALNLKESILTQLKEKNHDTFVYQIIEQYFDDNLNCDLNSLSKKTYLPVEQLRKRLSTALSFVSFYSFEEKNLFYNNTLFPDIIATYKKKKWELFINHTLIPPFFTNIKYLRYLKSNNTSLEKFIRTKFIKAKNLIENLEKRQKTLTIIFSYIINFHTDFLLGSQKTPSSLTIKEISAQLSLHLSTVSRALKNKILMCNGTFISIKQLVSSYTFNNKEALSSPHSIKQFIKELIATEDLNMPLSDKKISEKITSLKNIMCSRRTITKYRISLGIPSTFKRKNALINKTALYKIGKI